MSWWLGGEKIIDHEELEDRCTVGWALVFAALFRDGYSIRTWINRKEGSVFTLTLSAKIGGLSRDRIQLSGTL